MAKRFKDNLASDFSISDLWFLGQTAVQRKFANSAKVRRFLSENVLETL